MQIGGEMHMCSRNQDLIYGFFKDMSDVGVIEIH